MASGPTSSRRLCACCVWSSRGSLRGIFRRRRRISPRRRPIPEHFERCGVRRHPAWRDGPARRALAHRHRDDAPTRPRERLDLYCGLRPLYLFHQNDSPLRNHAAGHRYRPRAREHRGPLLLPQLAAIPGPGASKPALLITRAARRWSAPPSGADGAAEHVTLVDKANVLPSMAFFRRVFDEVAAEFPDVRPTASTSTRCPLPGPAPRSAST